MLAAKHWVQVLVSYAYPSSPLPNLVFKALTGCWHVWTQLGLANQAPLALVLEVEYAPVHYLDMGAPMLTAFVAAIRAAVGPDGATRCKLVQPAHNMCFSWGAQHVM